MSSVYLLIEYKEYEGQDQYTTRGVFSTVKLAEAAGNKIYDNYHTYDGKPYKPGPYDGWYVEEWEIDDNTL